MNTWLIGYLVFHFVCGFFSYGFSFSYFQNHYAVKAEENYRNDLMFCLVICFIGGPIALFWGIQMFGIKHGLKFK